MKKEYEKMKSVGIFADEGPRIVLKEMEIG